MGLDENNLPSQYYRSDAGGSSGGDANSYLTNSMQPYLDAISKLKEYDKANPFSFDEKLARDASTAEYAPYYKEMLTDYTSDVEKTKSRSSSDADKVLKQLQAGQEYYSGQARKSIDMSIKNSNEGFAGRGLYLSGARGEEAKRLESTYTDAYGPEGYKTGEYLASVDKTKTTLDRSTADANNLLSRYTRDTGREEKAAIEGGVLDRKGEYITQYETGRKNYYQNQIPGGYYTGIYG
jgi:hypothetical protein